MCECIFCSLILGYMYEDDGSSSTDEEEKYVEPWKEFVQQKDPVNELLYEI